MILNRILMILMIVCMFFSFALAEEKKGHSKKPSSKVALSFEDELITGAADKPTVQVLIEENRNKKFKKLLKIRNNFDPESERDLQLLPNK